MSKTRLIVSVTAALALAGGGALAAEESPCPEGKLVKSGTIEAHKGSAGFILGVRWGGGVLKLNNGQEHKFSFSGFKALETGVAAVDLVGEVYNLEKIQDFSGTYYGASTQISVVKSAGEVVVNNDKCVVVKAKASGGGVQLSAPAPGGVEVKLEE